MKHPKYIELHGEVFGGDCPKEWDMIPNYTGSYELDAAIHFTKNKDVFKRMNLYCSDNNTYGPGTGYNSYNGYSKDN